MKLLRIDGERGIDFENVQRMELKIGKQKFTLTETVDGRLAIMGHGSAVTVHPGCANVINVSVVMDEFDEEDDGE